MKSPENTTASAKSDPMGTFAEHAIVGPEAIERQEARGQGELVESDVLPTAGIESVRGIIESAGGTIGDAVRGDDIFTEVALPAGWSKQATDHSMWSELRDEKGRKRAAIFYKAAFYDRHADIRPTCRFTIDAYGHHVEGEVRATLLDASGEVQFTSNIIRVGDRKPWDVREEAYAVVERWLDNEYPKWREPEQYWE